ncbi:MAG: zinc-binding dehydrogenase [Candidatus Lokiarchaeota archaeon]|nr:zinc-binding dehydrogenase [Candidatus Lokiarchaeota archaeon]
MRAACITRHGGLEEIAIRDVDTPRPGHDELLVHMEFAALNHLDYFVTKGWPGLELEMPHVLGSDGSGIVEEVGPGVTSFKAGDSVAINPGLSCGKCEACLAGEQNACKSFTIKGEHQAGTFAEYFTVPESNALALPAGFPPDKSAAAPLVSLTAWRMLATRARVRPGEVVFVHGAGGGVSTAAIQIAKHLGATVITTTSTIEKAEKARKLGADHVIDYRSTPDYATHVFKDLTGKRGVDVVVDSVGARTFATSVRLLRPGGRLVTCGATTGPSTDLDIRQVFWKQLDILGSTMSTQKEFREAMRLVFTGTIDPVIDKVFPLDQARQAAEYLLQAGQFGKVLLRG